MASFGNSGSLEQWMSWEPHLLAVDRIRRRAEAALALAASNNPDSMFEELRFRALLLSETDALWQLITDAMRVGVTQSFRMLMQRLHEQTEDAAPEEGIFNSNPNAEHVGSLVSLSQVIDNMTRFQLVNLALLGSLLQECGSNLCKQEMQAMDMLMKPLHDTPELDRIRSAVEILLQKCGVDDATGLSRLLCCQKCQQASPHVLIEPCQHRLCFKCSRQSLRAGDLCNVCPHPTMCSSPLTQLSLTPLLPGNATLQSVGSPIASSCILPAPSTASAVAMQRAKRSGRGSCHQCKNHKMSHQMAYCASKTGESVAQNPGGRSSPNSSSKLRLCRKKFCNRCLMRYFESTTTVDQQPNWSCPACRGLCRCAACKRKRGRPNKHSFGIVEASPMQWSRLDEEIPAQLDEHDENASGDVGSWESSDFSTEAVEDGHNSMQKTQLPADITSLPLDEYDFETLETKILSFENEDENVSFLPPWNKDLEFAAG